MLCVVYLLAVLVQIGPGEEMCQGARRQDLLGKVWRAGRALLQRDSAEDCVVIGERRARLLANQRNFQR